MSLTTTVKAPGADGATFTFTTPFDAFASNAMDILKAHNDSVQAYVKSTAAKDHMVDAAWISNDNESVGKSQDTHSREALGYSHPFNPASLEKPEASGWGRRAADWADDWTPRPSACTSAKSASVDWNHVPSARSSEESSMRIDFCDAKTGEYVSIWFKQGDRASKMYEKYAITRDVPPNSFTLEWQGTPVPIDYVLGECIWGTMRGIDHGAEIVVTPKVADRWGE